MTVRSTALVAFLVLLLAGGAFLRPAAAWTYMSDYGSHGYSYRSGYGGHGSGYNFRVGSYGSSYGSSYRYSTGRGVSDPLGSRRTYASASAPSAPLWLRVIRGESTFTGHPKERPLCGTYNRAPAACTNTTTQYVAEILRQD